MLLYFEIIFFRKYDGATLECRASNNNVSHAQSRMLEIKINRKFKFTSKQNNNKNILLELLILIDK
jgi:hypothetical protein